MAFKVLVAVGNGNSSTRIAVDTSAIWLVASGISSAVEWYRRDCTSAAPTVQVPVAGLYNSAFVKG